jgi:hypothetical protein
VILKFTQLKVIWQRLILINESRPTVLEIVELLQSLISLQSSVAFSEEKQTLTFIDKGSFPCELTFPPVLPKMHGGCAEDLLQQMNQTTRTYTIVLIQAGAAAIGYYKNSELAKHKVIKKYMIRKSQGTSQIKYLKSKGKSRLGSRIRLKNSALFFEEINKTLTDWNIVLQSETILLSLPINLIHLLYTANVSVPFEKKDQRVKKIPIDVNVPCLKELGRIHWLVSRGRLERK